MALDREQWTRAALEALERDGVGAVAVEPLTRALGVTKGSFYWHFSGRDELLRAALELWTREHVDAPLQRAEAVADPAGRVRALFTAAAGKPGSIFIRLLDASADPVVAATVHAAAQARVDFLTRTFRALGRPPARARRDALLAYSAYVGIVHLERDAPDVVGDRAAFNRHVAQRLLDGQ